MSKPIKTPPKAAHRAVGAWLRTWQAIRCGLLWGALCLLGLNATLAQTPDPAPRAERPNIVVFLSR